MSENALENVVHIIIQWDLCFINTIHVLLSIYIKWLIFTAQCLDISYMDIICETFKSELETFPLLSLFFELLWGSHLQWALLVLENTALCMHTFKSFQSFSRGVFNGRNVKMFSPEFHFHSKKQTINIHNNLIPI